jgi:hypothetical protein
MPRLPLTRSLMSRSLVSRSLVSRSLVSRSLMSLGLIVAVTLGGCAADAPRRSADADAASSSGPTVYGRIGVSVDRVEVKH